MHLKMSQKFVCLISNSFKVYLMFLKADLDQRVLFKTSSHYYY